MFVRSVTLAGLQSVMTEEKLYVELLITLLLNFFKENNME